jgi:hypothetical protein
MLIAERFDERTVANMEVALERACRTLPIGGPHEARRHIAEKILECAKAGERTLGGLTAAGSAAATELCNAPRTKRSAGLSSQVNRPRR